MQSLTREPGWLCRRARAPTPGARRLCAVIALGLAGGLAPALAQPAADTTTFRNGDFAAGANGLTHWQSFGDAAVHGVRAAGTMTIAMLATGLGLIGWRLRRRQKAQQRDGVMA